MENNITPNQNKKYESLSNGDVYFINAANEQEMINIATSIAKSFNTPDHEIKDIIKELQSGKDWRFEGTYNLAFNANKNRLILDNRNGRGVQEFRDKLKEVVDAI
jgi:hypothetical protein